MAPTKFQIYVDQSIRQTATSAPPRSVDLPSSARVPVDDPPPLCLPNASDQPPRYKPEVLASNQRFYFDERRIYPPCGGEFSFEEINYKCWIKRQIQISERMRMEEIQRENAELKQKIEALNYQITVLVNAQKQMLTKPQGPPSPTNRLSIVPQSLQFTDRSLYGAINDAPSVLQDCWANTQALTQDRFTLPIDQSQYIRENVPTSTPTSKRHSNDNEKRSTLNNRRLSRPSMGGSPTLKLSPITETSRDCNSKSSSSSSAMSATPSTTKKVSPPLAEIAAIEEPVRPLDPLDPTTYMSLLRGLVEPLDRRSGYYKINRSLPRIRQGACFQAGSDSYLVDKELSQEARIFTAQLLIDDSNDDSCVDIPIKTVCFRVDSPANEWLYYICNELHRRLVKQKTRPDIELSVMIANPAIMYNDGSILVDEFFRFITLEHFFDACAEMNKPFPKAVAAYITLELILLVRQIHTCDIVHMNINPKNILIICCPTREDIANVDERTSIVKLIGFDRAMDMRLLPGDFKFEGKLENLNSCEMMDSKAWTYEVDWFGTLNCIHKMFFLEEMIPKKEGNRWILDKQFKNFPTNVWSSLFEGLLNIGELDSAASLIEQATEEISTWIKANISFVLKEADMLDRILEEYCKATNKSIRT